MPIQIKVADYFCYHGLGNDYLVIDPAFCPIPMTPQNIQLICHRNFGVGSDGILYGPLSNPQYQAQSQRQNAPKQFEIYNPDGSAAEKSGNGIRIFAQYLLDQGYVCGSTFSLEILLDGQVVGRVHLEVIDSEQRIIKVQMGYASLHASDVPVNVTKLSSYNINELDETGEVVGLTLEAGKRNFSVTCVTVSNPHCVVIDAGGKAKISAEEARIYGPLIENHPAFANRSNVQFLQVLDKHTTKIEIWERGAGYTLASGTSSCAAAVAAWRNGLVESPVRVQMPGGEFTIDIKPLDICPVANQAKEQPATENRSAQWQHACASLELTGPVSGICYGTFLPDLLRQLER